MRFTEFIKGPAPKQTKTQFTEMELAIMEGGGSLEPAVELPVVKRQSALSQAMGEAEMGTAYARNISQEFRKLGYKKIGSGADSTVFAKEAGYVIKILMPEDPGSRAVEVFKKFYEFCLQHQDLKCLPVINEYNTIDVLDKEYIQIDMERLFPIRKNTFSEAMVWYLSDYVSNDIAWPAVKAELSNPDKWEESHWPSHADKIANKVKNLTADQEQTWSELYSVMSMLFKTGRINKLGWDLHTENVMQRKNGDLVIIDPWFADNTLLESNLEEKWSQKYKKSINCSNPKGFSQRAHCQGRKKNEGVEANLNTKYSLKNMFGDVKSLDNLSLEQLNKAMDGRVTLVGRKFRSQEGRSFRYDVKLANGEWYIMHVVYVHGLIDAWLTDEENNKIPLSKFKAKGVAEGKLNESAIFLNPNTVIVGQEHGRPLNLSPETMKKVQAIAAKHGAWYEGNGADRVHTKGQIDNYVGSFDDDVAKTASSNDPKWLYVLFANVDANNRVQRVGVDPEDTIFNRLLATAKDNSFQGIGFTAQALQKFLAMASEGKYDFVKMSQQPATQENLTRFLKAGEALMWPANWEQYPNKAGKIAKSATVDARDQYLASRKAGVYVVGSGHLKAVQQITGKQVAAEGAITESQKFDFDGNKQQIINFAKDVLAGKTGGFGRGKGNLFYHLLTGPTKVGDASRIGLSDEVQKLWRDYFSKAPFIGGADGEPWSQVNINDDQFARATGNRTLNFYVTVNKDKENILNFFRNIHKLPGYLKPISDKYQTPINFKTHSRLDSFVGHNDSLKVYWYDPKVKDLVANATRKWLSDSNIATGTRTHDMGVDVKGDGGGSFGEILAGHIYDTFTKLIKTQGNKYTPEQYFAWLKQNFNKLVSQVQPKKESVAEAINPDITNPEFSHQQQIGDYLYVARYWSKGLKISAYHGNKQIGYAELMYQTAPFDDFADPKTTPKRVWLESEWTKVNPKYQRQGIMSTMYAYAKMLGNSVKPSQTRSDDAKAAWSSWRQSGDAKHLTSNEGVAEGSEQISIQVRKGRSKFATELSVDGKPAGAYQYDADSGRSIAEVYPEYKGKGFGKILVLHAIYTAAKLGMNFVEDESRTAEYDNVLDSLDSNGLAVNDDGYWYVTGEGEHFLKQRLKQGVAENFADGKVKGKSRPGRVKRAGASCDGSVTDLRAKAKNASGEKSKMYHWCANMKSGKK